MPYSLSFRQKIREKLQHLHIREITSQEIQGVYQSISPDQHFKASEIPHGTTGDYNVRLPESLSGLLAQMYRDAENTLLKKQLVRPCDYAVMGIGSIGKQQATTYSDLEFAIITEKENEVTIKDYFQALTAIVRSKVESLNETNKGISFDEGDHTPTNLKLINTIDKFLNYLTGSEVGEDPVLHSMLANTAFIYGKESLYDEYKEQAVHWLATDNNGSVIFEGLITDGPGDALDPATQTSAQINARQSARESIKARLGQLEQHITSEDFQEINIKQEVHRPIELLVLLYAGRNGWFNESIFQLVHRLYHQQQIPEYQATLLNKCVAYAEFLRLSAYDYYESRKSHEVVKEPSLFDQHPEYTECLTEYAHDLRTLYEQLIIGEVIDPTP